MVQEGDSVGDKVGGKVGDEVGQVVGEEVEHKEGNSSSEGEDKKGRKEEQMEELKVRPDSKWRSIQISQQMRKSFPEIWSRVYPPSFRMIWEGSLHTVTPPHPQGMSHELLDSSLGLH